MNNSTNIESVTIGLAIRTIIPAGIFAYDLLRRSLGLLLDSAGVPLEFKGSHITSARIVFLFEANDPRRAIPELSKILGKLGIADSAHIAIRTPGAGWVTVQGDKTIKFERFCSPEAFQEAKGYREKLESEAFAALRRFPGGE
jgi:hypothetical protein